MACLVEALLDLSSISRVVIVVSDEMELINAVTKKRFCLLELCNIVRNYNAVTGS